MLNVTEMRDWLRAEPEDSVLVESLTSAAIAMAERETGLALTNAREVVQVAAWDGGPVWLRGVPDADAGVVVERWTGSGYEVVPADSYSVESSVLRMTSTWRPAGRTRLRITYTAGMTREDIPQDLQVAIKLLVAHWYEERQVVQTGRTVTELPFGVERIFFGYARPTI